MNNYPNLTTFRSWECHKCGRVYSPSTSMCSFCNNQGINVHFNTSVNTSIEEPLKQAYKELSEIESIFPKGSKHKAYLHITKRMKEILLKIQTNNHGKHN